MQAKFVFFACFEPTYKELKPLKASTRVSSDELSFEPTYKELKREFGDMCRVWWKSFEPTYKELKLF